MARLDVKPNPRLDLGARILRAQLIEAHNVYQLQHKSEEINYFDFVAEYISRKEAQGSL